MRGIIQASMLAIGVVSVSHAQTSAPAPHQIRPEHNLLAYGIVDTAPGFAQVRVDDVVYKTAGGRELHMNVYRPPKGAGAAALPVVVFVNGVGDWPNGKPVRTWGQYTSWGRFIAASGFVAVTFDARGDVANAEDVASAIAYVRDKGASMGIDPSRIGLWACSANVRAALAYVMAPQPPPLRAAVLYYGAGEVATVRVDLPVQLVRAGRDRPNMNEMVDRLAAQAVAADAPWTLVNVPNGHHAFDVLDDTDESRAAIRGTVAFLRDRLTSQPAAAPPAGARAALAHSFAGEWADAEASYTRWVAAHPGDADALFMLANAQVELHKNDEAEANLRKALAIDPGIAEAWTILGRVEVDKKNYPAAIEALNKAVALQPEDGEARFQLGKALLARHDTDAAIEQLQNAVRLNPGNGWAWNSLAYAYLEAKQPAKAAESFERVLPYAPTNPTLLYNTACSYALAGNTDKAIELLDRLVASGYKDKSALMSDPDLAAVRNDPRFAELVKRIG
jgi:tetratricopeptide (TPR) repeat protein